MFAEAFIGGLIVGALALTSLSIVALLILLLRDYLDGRLW